jgi:uncharacterized protein YndB with AHSA1/START domain
MATVSITPDQDVVLAEIHIAAPPERVFQAITDPRQTQQWWGQKEMYRVTEWTADLTPGGQWSSVGVGADGKQFRVDGEYLEVDPPRLLVHTWIPSFAPELRTVVRWELEPQSVHGLHPSGPRKAGTGTLVRIHHRGFAGNLSAAEGHRKGWQRVLGWMQLFVEKGETIDTRT